MFDKLILEGILIIYPMKSKLRQLERNVKIIDDLRKEYKHFIDLSHFEKQNEFLEGTGSLLVDNLGKKFYCSASERATKKVLFSFLKEFNKYCDKKYTLFNFSSYDSKDRMIYHTNCVMSILEKHVVICLDAIRDKKERKMIHDSIKENREIINITMKEMENYGANIINVGRNSSNIPVLVLSQTAYDNYTDKTKAELEKHYDLCIVNIKTIERIGGGSARCMIAELF